MSDYREKLMSWQPESEGFSRDDVMLAVGLQCREKKFPVRDVLNWLGIPDKVCGDAAGGHLVYFYEGPNEIAREDETAYLYDVADGKVIDFGSIARYRNNAIRPDGETHFNVLDEMDAFDERCFHYRNKR